MRFFPDHFFLNFLTISIIFISNTPLYALPRNSDLPFKDIVLIGLGDSLTHGTMDATNNATNTLNAYLQKVYESLDQVVSVSFAQPLFDRYENRIMPFCIPTNLGVDGADIFSLEGLEYYKRHDVNKSLISGSYLCDKLFPWQLRDLYDKVLYPLNLLARKPVSQLDAGIWLLNQIATRKGQSEALVILWIGNNDSSNASLGYGTHNPLFIPLPLDQIEHELNPLLSSLLRLREQQGFISFEPYSLSSIKRNLTEADDFLEQYNGILTRLENKVPSLYDNAELFLCTLPYYSSVGYLFDSDDMEFYLRKANPDYIVPASFKRAAEIGKEFTHFLPGDRISLFTFLTMYVLLDQGYSVAYVNQILEVDGQQRDGLVLSEEEQQYIISRIDSFNLAIKEAALSRGTHVHLIDIGQYLNEALTGETTITVNDKIFNRRWGRGNSFTTDGVHPGYTAQALIANFIVEQLNNVLQLGAPLCVIPDVLEQDPYIDWDGDGWIAGPDYLAFGLTELLFLLKDPDDSDPTVEPILPHDIWNRISKVLLREFLF